MSCQPPRNGGSASDYLSGFAWFGARVMGPTRERLSVCLFIGALGVNFRICRDVVRRQPAECWRVRGAPVPRLYRRPGTPCERWRWRRHRPPRLRPALSVVDSPVAAARIAADRRGRVGLTLGRRCRAEREICAVRRRLSTLVGALERVSPGSSLRVHVSTGGLGSWETFRVSSGG